MAVDDVHSSCPKNHHDSRYKLIHVVHNSLLSSDGGSFSGYELVEADDGILRLSGGH